MEASLTEEVSSASKERRTCTASDAGIEVEEAMEMEGARIGEARAT